jgi:hypothetical protein
MIGLTRVAAFVSSHVSISLLREAENAQPPAY